MATETMDRLNRMWGLIVLRGVTAILFGILAFVWPGITLAALVLVWGAYALIDGLCALIASLRLDDGKPMWTLAVVGLLGIAAGLLTLVWPQITALLLLWVIAGWAVVTCATLASPALPPRLSTTFTADAIVCWRGA